MNQLYRRGERKHRYYGEDGTVYEAESRDMWKERAKRTAALSNREG